MMRIPLNMPFKGHRTYIHGPDIYNFAQAALREKVDPSAYITLLAMRQISGTACVLCTDPESHETVGATIKFMTPAGPKTASLVATDDPVKDRIDFDEDGIVAGAVIDGDRITLDENTKYSVVENVVALTKKLHNSLHPLDDEGRWVVIRLDVNENLDDATNPIGVELINNLKGRATVSRILSDDREIGRIQFGVYKE